jgi:hypothetical protein
VVRFAPHSVASCTVVMVREGERREHALAHPESELAVRRLFPGRPAPRGRAFAPCRSGTSPCREPYIRRVLGLGRDREPERDSPDGCASVDQVPSWSVKGGRIPAAGCPNALRA